MISQGVKAGAVLFSALLCQFTLAQSTSRSSAPPLPATPTSVGKPSMLRLACDGNNVGAEITVNNRFKGDCPIDVEVQAGDIRLRAYRKVDNEREQVFEQEFRIGEGVVKRVDINLGPVRLNEDGRTREAERQRQAAEQRRIDDERRRKEAEEAKRRDDERKRLEAERAAKLAEWKRLAPAQNEERRQFRLAQTNAAFASAGLVAGNAQAFRDCPTCPEMVWVPPGKAVARDGNDFRRWLGSIEIGVPIAVGKFEVTFDEWDACVAEGGCSRRPAGGKTEGIIFDSEWGRGRQPVINITPQDARQYVSWLGKKTGQPYRLLSVAEANYVRFAGQRSAFPWGDALDAGRANCVGCGSKFDGERPVAVGSFPPNAWGIHDMIGNVAEFGADCLGSLARLRQPQTIQAFEQMIDVRNAPRDGSPLDLCKTSTGAAISDPVYATHGGSFRTMPLIVQYDSASSMGPSGGFRVARGFVFERRTFPAEQFQPFRDCADCPELVNIPAGEYEMGLPYDAPNPIESQMPLRRVTVTAFAMGLTEVTRAQFAAFIKDSAYTPTGTCLTMENMVNNRLSFSERMDRNWASPGFMQEDTHPVVCVNVADARAYVAWLSAKTAQAYRLPSEAEWEYAARADDTRLFLQLQGATTCAMGNVADASLKLATQWQGTDCNDQFVYTAPVKRFRPNAWGLHDLFGNVTEMLEDCSNPNYFGAPQSAVAWKTGDCARTVVRGPTWSGAGSLSYAARGIGGAMGASTRGFRVVRDASPQGAAVSTPLKQ
jgi:formylglycine-generating enzyme required for sulfatase activity